jgi:type I site-specific restriction-modification system R (restriction) subunit
MENPTIVVITDRNDLDVKAADKPPSLAFRA